MVNRILGPDDLQGFSAELAATLKPGMALLLRGPLGAGKTTLARAIIAAMAGEDEAASPTFPLCLTYDTSQGTIWHYDLYRLTPGADLDELGWSEARSDGIAIVEWPERARADQLYGPVINVTIGFTDHDNQRCVEVMP